MADKTKKKKDGEEDELDPDVIDAAVDADDTKLDEDADEEWTDVATESEEDF